MIAFVLSLAGGSKLMKYAIVALVAGLILFGIIRTLMSAGAAKERAKVQTARLVAVVRKLEVDDEIAKMDRAARRAEFDRWLRHGPGTG